MMLLQEGITSGGSGLLLGNLSSPGETTEAAPSHPLHLPAQVTKGAVTERTSNMMKEDLFLTASPTAINLKQDNIPKPKRPYKKNRASKRMVTQAESFQINKLLEANLTPKDENGIVAYLNDMDDDKIAKLIGPHVSLYSVRHLRQEVFGVIRKISPRKHDTDTNALEARVAELEKNLMQISKHAVSRLTRVEEMFNKLCEEAGSSLKIKIPER